MNNSSRVFASCLRSLFAHDQFEGMSDPEVLRHFLETRCDDAFSALMRRHGPMVFGLARRIVRDHQIAEDVYQATFLVLARKARAVRGRESLAAWLHSVAFRLAIRADKGRRRSRDHEARAATASSPDPLDLLTAREFLTILDEELNNLPEKHRLPLILCHLEGLPMEKAAKRLGLCLGALRGRLERARLRLRQRLAKRGLALGTTLTGSLPWAPTAMAVPPALVQATLKAALTSQGVSLVATALAKDAIWMMYLAKVRSVFLGVLLLGTVGLGAGWVTIAAGTAEQQDPAAAPPKVVAKAEPAVQPKEKPVDLHGDPLPEGAAMRLGTVHLRAVAAKLALTPDGKSLIGVQSGKYVSSWDVASGKLKETREFPSSSSQMSVLSPDARWLATDGDSLKVFDIQTGKLVHQLAPAKDNFFMGAFSQDGTHLAAVGAPRPPGNIYLIRVWDLASGNQTFAKEIKREGGTQFVCFAPDAKKLLTGFAPAMYCWDLVTGQQLWQSKNFHMHTQVPAFTPEGILLSSSPPWDVGAGKPARVDNLPDIRLGNPHLAVTRDGQTLLVSSAEGVAVWDLKTGNQKRLLSGAGDEMVLAPDGNTLITNNGCLQRWDLASGKPLYADNFKEGHSDEVVDVVFSADGKRMASAAVDGSVRFWDVTTGRPIHVWRAHEARWRLPRIPTGKDGASALAMTPDGRWIISAGSEQRLRLWDSLTGQEAGTFSIPDTGGENWQYVFRLRISPDGSEAVGLFGAEGFFRSEKGELVDYNHWLANWDLPKGGLLAKRPVPVTSWISSSLSRDAKTLVLRPRLNVAREAYAVPSVIDVSSGKETVRLDYKFNNQTSIPPPLVISPNGLLIAGACLQEAAKGPTRGVNVWEAATGQTIAQFKTKSSIGQLAFHPGNRFVALSDSDGVQVWDVVAGKVIATRELPRHVRPSTTWSDRLDTYTNCLTFTPDGRRLATGHPDGTILFWDLELPVPKPVRLAPKEIESLWGDLKDADAAKAWQAVWRLGDSPEEVAPFLHKIVKPFPPPAAEIMGPLLEDLGSDVFAKRAAASKRLKDLGLLAEPALRQRLKAGPPLELRQRIEALLKALIETPQPLTQNSLRDVRAVAVLSRINTPLSRQILEELSKEGDSAPLTVAAKAALAP